MHKEQFRAIYEALDKLTVALQLNTAYTALLLEKQDDITETEIENKYTEIASLVTGCCHIEQVRRQLASATPDTEQQ